MNFQGLASFLFSNNVTSKIGSITVDCIMQDTHTYISDITDYPVENGSYIQDNVWIKPIVYNMRGVINDISLKNALLQDKMSPQEAMTALLRLRDDKTLFDIVTSFKIYNDMIFTKFEPMRDGKTGHALSFTADFKQIKKVTSQVAIINKNTSSKNMEKKVDKGQVQTKDAPEKVKEDASLLAEQIYHWGQS